MVVRSSWMVTSVVTGASVSFEVGTAVGATENRSRWTRSPVTPVPITVFSTVSMNGAGPQM